MVHAFAVGWAAWKRFIEPFALAWLVRISWTSSKGGASGPRRPIARRRGALGGAIVNFALVGAPARRQRSRGRDARGGRDDAGIVEGVRVAVALVVKTEADRPVASESMRRGRG